MPLRQLLSKHEKRAYCCISLQITATKERFKGKWLAFISSGMMKIFCKGVTEKHKNRWFHRTIHIF